MKRGGPGCNHAIKGNHDYVDGKSGSPTESWVSLWGYPSNHSIEIGEFAFIMADTSAASKADVYLAANLDWLKQQLEHHQDAPAIMMKREYMFRVIAVISSTAMWVAAGARNGVIESSKFTKTTG